jgi:hypothetical protein
VAAGPAQGRHNSTPGSAPAGCFLAVAFMAMALPGGHQRAVLLGCATAGGIAAAVCVHKWQQQRQRQQHAGTGNTALLRCHDLGLLDLLAVTGIHAQILAHLSIPTLHRLRRCSRAFRDGPSVADAIARHPRLALVGGKQGEVYILEWGGGGPLARPMRWRRLPHTMGSATLAERWRPGAARRRPLPELRRRGVFGREECVAWSERGGGLVVAGGRVASPYRMQDHDSAEFLAGQHLRIRCGGLPGEEQQQRQQQEEEEEEKEEEVEVRGGGGCGWATLGGGLASARSGSVAVALPGGRGGALVLGGLEDPPPSAGDDDDGGGGGGGGSDVGANLRELASIERVFLRDGHAAGGGGGGGGGGGSFAAATGTAATPAPAGDPSGGGSLELVTRPYRQQRLYRARTAFGAALCERAVVSTSAASSSASGSGRCVHEQREPRWQRVAVVVAGGSNAQGTLAKAELLQMCFRDDEEEEDAEAGAGGGTACSRCAGKTTREHVRNDGGRQWTAGQTEQFRQLRLPPMSVARWNCSAAQLPCGRAAVFGGGDGAGRSWYHLRVIIIMIGTLD